MNKIQFDLSDKERFGEIKVRHMRLMQSGDADLDTMVNVMSRFMVSDGEYLDVKAAFNILDDLTVNQLNDVATAFKDAVEDLSVPKANGN